MLKRKMLRDIKENFAQFFSIMLLSLVAMWCYMGFQANCRPRCSAEYLPDQDGRTVPL